MNNYWVGVIVGCSIGAIFSLVALISYVDRVNNLTEQVKELNEKVEKHDEIMKQYEFYVWHNMKFFEEKEEKK